MTSKNNMEIVTTDNIIFIMIKFVRIDSGF